VKSWPVTSSSKISIVSIESVFFLKGCIYIFVCIFLKECIYIFVKVYFKLAVLT